MEESERELRLRSTERNPADGIRATLIVDRLAASRPVSGEGPEWRVAYADVDVARALKMCEAELSAIDPRWMEVLDFEAVPSTPIPDPEFS